MVQTIGRNIGYLWSHIIVSVLPAFSQMLLPLMDIIDSNIYIYIHILLWIISVPIYIGTYIYIYRYLYIYRINGSVPNHLSGTQKIGNSRNLAIFCGTVQVFYICSGILRRNFNRLIKVRQTLFYEYINLYLLKAISLFTFHSLFYILSTIFILYP